MTNKLLGLCLLIGATVLSALVERLNLPVRHLVAVTVLAYCIAGLTWLAMRKRAATVKRGAGVPTIDDWREFEKRFGDIVGEVTATWRYYPATGLVLWNVQPQTAGPQKTSGTVRDRDRFLAEAQAAGVLIRRMGFEMPAKFTTQAGIDPADDWFNAVAALVDLRNEMTGSGADNSLGELGRYEVGYISDAVAASRDTCARLAAASQIVP